MAEQCELTYPSVSIPSPATYLVQALVGALQSTSYSLYLPQYYFIYSSLERSDIL
jgi:hypothetical protein